jgi:hypothetical protein
MEQMRSKATEQTRRGFFGLIALALGIRHKPVWACGGIVPKGMPAMIHAHDNVLPPILWGKMQIHYHAHEREFIEYRKIWADEITRLFAVPRRSLSMTINDLVATPDPAVSDRHTPEQATVDARRF